MEDLKQQWVKKGLLLKPNKNISWMKSHVSVPVLENLDKDQYRIYFCSRDIKNRNQIGFADFDINFPEQTIKVHNSPVLSIGELGAFDDNGVTPSYIINIKGKKYLYYVGWNKGSTVRMHLYTGLAISEDGGYSFKRYARSPLLERIKIDPLLTATLSILYENNIYRMWYISGDRWFKVGKETFPEYNIKYAESNDGINWSRNGKICINYKDRNEHALARPFVLKENGIYKMWFSFKGENYKIGYAESIDGFEWIRKDEEIFFKKSKYNFDSQMQEYAFIVNHNNKKFMFYNGNEYGKDGIGYAILDGKKS